MPEGNPEAYMEQGMPEDEAMAAAGMGPEPMGPMAPGPEAPPMGMGPMGGMPPDQDAMMMMLMQALVQKWGSAEAQVAGEKGTLVDTMMQLAMPQPSFGPQDMVEGAPGQGMPPMGA